MRIKVAGFVDNAMVTEEFELSVPEGSTVKKVMSLADKSGKMKRPVIKKIMRMPRPPTVLLNGTGLDIPGGLSSKVNEGDELAVMTPVAGG